MSFIVRVVALLTIANINLLSAQSTQYGSCVTSCFSTSPISSACDGTKTGDALARCTCASFSGGTSNPLIACIRKCPEDQQLPYARNLPALCNASLFPNLNLATSSSASSGSGQTVTSSGSGGQATSGATSSTTTSSTAATATSATSTGGQERTGASMQMLLGVAAIVGLHCM